MTHPQTNCLCEPARACSCRHPTIKQLEEVRSEIENALHRNQRHADKDSVLNMGFVLKDNGRLIVDVLRTLIEKHEDVEGDMPQELFLLEGSIGLMPVNGTTVQGTPYHRADTIINEMTRRIEDATHTKD
jgi:hypothetical protein